MYLILTDNQVIEKPDEDVRYLDDDFYEDVRYLEDGFYGIFEGFMEVPYPAKNVCKAGSYCSFDEEFTRELPREGGLLVTRDYEKMGYQKPVKVPYIKKNNCLTVIKNKTDVGYYKPCKLK